MIRLCKCYNLEQLNQRIAVYLINEFDGINVPSGRFMETQILDPVAYVNPITGEVRSSDLSIKPT